MGGILRFAYVMAIGRAVSSWRLEAVLFGGILLAVALMASGVIFSELLANAALRDALTRSEPRDVNLKVRTFSGQDDPPDVEGRSAAFRARDEFVRRNVREPFGDYLADHTRLIKSATFFFQGRPHLELDNDTRPRGSVIHMEGLEERVRVLDGRLPIDPHPKPEGEESEPLPVAVDEFGAQLLGMGVGDVMEIFPASLFDDLPPIEVRIAAVFEALEPADPIWYDVGPAFSRQDNPSTGSGWTLVHLLTSEDALLERALGSYPTIYADTTWYFIPDYGKIHASETVEIQRLLGQIEWTVTSGLQNSGYTIRLDDLLRDFERQLLLAQVPLLLMLFLFVAILTYYLALIAGLIVRSRSAEITLLKSRGATPLQIAVLGLGEGLIVAIPAVIAGPYVALGLIKLLGFVFFRLSGAGASTGHAALCAGGDGLEACGAVSVPVGVSLDSFLIGIAGGILAVVVFTATTLLASRRGGVEARQASSRPPTSNFFQRYYLDVALLAVIGLLWWQLQSRGAFLVQSLGSSELSIDYSLLVGPVLGLVAAGLIVLRVFPWATALLANGLNTRWAGPFAPSWLLHVLRHLSRDPLTPAMLIVLVMLATALGVIGSSFSATLERGQREQALYEAGADLRLRFASLDHSVCHSEGSSTPTGRDAGDNTACGGAAAVVADLGEVAAATDGYRSTAFLTTTGFSTSGALLALQSGSLADTAWFREDFAAVLAAGAEGEGGHTVLGRVAAALDPVPGRGRPYPGPPLNSHPQGGRVSEGEGISGVDGIALPADATELVLWSRAGGSSPYLGVWARLQDGRGQIIDAWMGDLEQPVWTRLSLPLTEDGFRGNIPDWRWRPLNAQPPYTLLSFSVRSRLGENEGGAIFFGRVDAVLKAGARHAGALCPQPGGACEVLLHDFRSLKTHPPVPSGPEQSGDADWGWHVIEDFRKPGLHSLETSESAADVVRHDEHGAVVPGSDTVTRFDDTARFSFSSGSVGRTGIRVGGPDEPVPALASSRFLEVADVAVGDTAVLGMSNYSLELEVAGELEFFPTLDPAEEPFVVMDLDGFNRAAVRHNPAPPQGPNELWIRLNPAHAGDDGRAYVEAVTGALKDAGVTVREQHEAQSMVASRLDRPLVNAGWGALLVLLFLAITLASASGLLLFSHLDANERQTEFALLRTLGISRGQMLTILWAGLSIMVLSGVALGTLLGWLLGASLLPLMEVAEAGERITPSLVFTADWQRLVISYAVLAAVALCAGLWLAWLTGKLQLHQVLRMGE